MALGITLSASDQLLRYRVGGRRSSAAFAFPQGLSNVFGRYCDSFSKKEFRAFYKRLMGTAESPKRNARNIARRDLQLTGNSQLHDWYACSGVFEKMRERGPFPKRP